ncbi:tetratricopeptide repeat protein [Maridesulfovibrio zosterae]|uniref:tetratricopeptide repeat protein n=1 Tax=Maridesulfovibrio zosterae TaxID=82171 RepID=UPI000427AA8B|nr:tetratricopeptide repeat protein [Maridesulfovibrio zosterae]
MKNRSFARFSKKTALFGTTLLLAGLLTGCGTKDEAAGLHQTGTVAFMLNCDQAASVYFEKAIDANPEYGPSYIMLGDCYLREGKYQKAVDVINQGLRLKLEEGHKRLAHRKLARAYKEMGKSQQALEQITIYTRMSVYQDKLTPEKMLETEDFMATLRLPEGQHVVSVEQIVDQTKKARASTNGTSQDDEDFIDMISFGLI